MTATLWICIEEESSNVLAILAAEALAAAVKKQGRANFEVVFLDRAGPFTLPRNPGPGDRLLQVGGRSLAHEFALLPASHASIEEVLDNPVKVVAEIFKLTDPVRKSMTQSRRIVAVTSCPTGIAHTFMAAEALRKAAEALGHKLRIETQGADGTGNPLTADEIAQADFVLIAAEREVDRQRFEGKPVFVHSAKKAILDGPNVILEAVRKIEQSGSEAMPEEKAERASGPYKHLMTGVSFMLPFVVAGGLLIALAFALEGIDAASAEGSLAQVLVIIGKQGGFALMVPVLSGYIAFSVADRPGIAPGMIGGVVCNILGAGFLGGIISGFVAGYGVFWLNRLLRLPKNLAGLKPVLLLPLLGTLLTGIIMYYVIGTPAALLNQFLTAQLRGLESGAGTIALGAILGAMMGFDMGGPVNKAAYAFSTGLLEAGIYMPMAASMAGGMTPPLAAALATRLFPNRFTMEEKKAGGAALVLGLAFVSEGAIPFAARDPLRVIPAFVLGSAVAGAAAMALGVRLMAPHGGIFVLPIPKAMDGIAEYSVALAAGTAVSAFLLGLLKRPYDSSIESGFSREKGGAVDERGKMNFFKKICNFFRKQV